MNNIGLAISIAGALVGFAVVCDLVHKWKGEIERTKRSESDLKAKWQKQLQDNIRLCKKNSELKESLEHMKHMYNELFDVLKSEINGIKK